MMRDTPRTFVGSVAFLLDGPVCAHIADDVLCQVGQLLGVSGCVLDVAAGTLWVTADEPVDRTDVLGLLDQVGCRVRR